MVAIVGDVVKLSDMTNDRLFDADDIRRARRGGEASFRWANLSADERAFIREQVCMIPRTQEDGRAALIELLDAAEDR